MALGPFGQRRVRKANADCRTTLSNVAALSIITVPLSKFARQKQMKSEKQRERTTQTQAKAKTKTGTQDTRRKTQDK